MLVNRVIHKLTVFVACGVLLSSCVTMRYFEVEVLAPAKTVIQSSGPNVGFVSKFELFKDLPKESDIVWRKDSVLYVKAINSVKNGMNSGLKFNVLDVSVQQEKMLTKKDLIEPLLWDRISAACPDSLDLLFFLESLTLNYKSVPYYNYDNETGIGLKVNGRSVWKICDLREKSYTELTLREEIPVVPIYDAFSVFSPYSSEADSSYFYDAAIDFGEAISQYLEPTWQAKERSFFDSKRLFPEAKNHLEDGRWEEAATVWIKCTNSRDKQLAARASYNMALASEMMNRIDIALEWINKSADLGLKDVAETYKKELIERKAAIEQLNQITHNAKIPISTNSTQ